MATCFPEAYFDYKVIHKRSPSSFGICGIKEIWGNIIPEINKNNINSLYAGSLVLEYLLNKYDNNLFLALKHYKGADKNLKSVERVINIYKEIKWKEKKLKDYLTNARVILL